MEKEIKTACKSCGKEFRTTYPSLLREPPTAPSAEEARFVLNSHQDAILKHQNEDEGCREKRFGKDYKRCKCGEDRLSLKWGTLKAWHFHTDNAERIMREYNAIGSSFSAMSQRDTPRQKELICELIDECNGEIYNDWEGKVMTKEEAKKYVLEYGINP